MSEITVQLSDAQWRSRSVRYYKGDWDAIQSVMPEFELLPFSAAEKEPANPFMQVVLRKPLSATERPMPVGVVSHSYSLAQHRTIAAVCRDGIVEAGVSAHDLQYELGLSELGEWMNFRIYLPESYCFEDAHGQKLGLRLECFNSVDGSSRLVVVFGWLRFVCSNGLIIGETLIQIRERHGQTLDIKTIPARIRKAIAVAQADKARMKTWQSEGVAIGDITSWANGKVSDQWGKKAAARVFHICLDGKDVEITDPFAPGLASEKPIRFLTQVPGAPTCAKSKYDVLQALSYVATRRRNAEEQTDRQMEIPSLLSALPVHRI